jgi:hypothetical protein
MDITMYALEFEGISALVMNSNEALLRGGDDKGRDPAAWELAHYMDKTYRNAAGQFIIPARAIKKCFIQACSFLPEKPKGVSFRSYGPFIQSATLIPEDAILDVTTEQVRPLTLIVSLDPSKGNKSPRGPRTRPAIAPPWHAKTTLQVIDPILKPDVLQRIADRAGTQVGLLDGRSIDFGRCLIAVKKAK